MVWCLNDAYDDASALCLSRLTRSPNESEIDVHVYDVNGACVRTLCERDAQ
jgi:hypothetical protein